MYLLPSKGGRRLSVAIHPAVVKPVVTNSRRLTAKIPDRWRAFLPGVMALLDSMPGLLVLQIIGSSAIRIRIDSPGSHFARRVSVTALAARQPPASRSIARSPGFGRKNPA